MHVPIHFTSDVLINGQRDTCGSSEGRRASEPARGPMRSHSSSNMSFSPPMSPLLRRTTEVAAKTTGQRPVRVGTRMSGQARTSAKRWRNTLIAWF